jgi:hypothetical protein
MNAGLTATYILFDTDPGHTQACLELKTDQYIVEELVTLAAQFVSEFSARVECGPQPSGAIATEFVRFLEREGYDLWVAYTSAKPDDIGKHIAIECAKNDEPMRLVISGEWGIVSPPAGAVLLS